MRHTTGIILLGMIFILGYGFSCQGDDTEMISVSKNEWAQMQAELAAVQANLEFQKSEVEAQKKAEAEKKRTAPQTKIGGRFYFDAAASQLNGDGEAILGDEMNGSRFRTARLGVKGTQYEMIEYEMEIDFAGSQLLAKNVFLGLKNLPSGIDVRLGHFKEPWSMESLTSSTSTVMMERSVLNDTKNVCGGRNNGFMLHNWHSADRWTWAVGGFAASMPETFEKVDLSRNLAVTARTTFLPFFSEYAPGKYSLWHLGTSYSSRWFNQENASANGTSFKTGADSSIARSVMSTGTLSGLDSLNAFLVESSWVRGPLSVDFEQAFFWMNDEYAGDAAVQAGYAQVSYVLTGESRNYKKNGGCFGALKPDRPFVRTCRDGVGVFSGPGAWEIAYRCGWIDSGELACNEYSGGKMGQTVNHVMGLNWHLNQNCRVMLNYVLANTDYEGRPDGRHCREQVWETRFQMVF